MLLAQEQPVDAKDNKDFLEIKRHIEAQKRLTDDPIDEAEICTAAAISRMHRKFYEGMSDEFLYIKPNDEGEIVRLVPGECREVGGYRIEGGD